MNAHTADGAAPAGFWPRCVAWSLDAACLLPLTWLLCQAAMARAWADAGQAWQALLAALLPRLQQQAGVQNPLGLATQLLADPGLRAASERLQAALDSLVWVPCVTFVLLSALWSLGFECSRWQASPGKRALALQVVDAQGRRLTHLRALLRFVAAGLSWATLNLGHALVLLPPHLALHDHLSATRVRALAGNTALPGWARAWLWLQALLLLAATGYAFLWLQAGMQAAMQQVLQGF